MDKELNHQDHLVIEEALKDSLPASGPISFHVTEPVVENSVKIHKYILINPVKFALYGGMAMILIGIVSLFNPGTTAGLPILFEESNYGLFLDLVPMNLFNKIALIVLGLIGMSCATRKESVLNSIAWSQFIFIAMAVFSVLGVIPSTNTFFGYMPLFGGEVAVNGIFALLGAYYGYARKLL